MGKTIAIWGGVIVGVLAVLIILSSLGSGGGNPTVSGTPNPQISVLLPTDHTLGDKTSKVVVVEYADFQCPACAVFNQPVKQLIEEQGSKFLFVYREFPLGSIHPNGQLAGQVAEAADMQNKFWEMHDLLYDKQSEWSDLSSADARTKFIAYAQTLGLNATKFNADIDSQAAKDAVQAGAQSGNSFGIRSTPSFFVNGARVGDPSKGTSYDQLKAAVQQAIAANQ